LIEKERLWESSNDSDWYQWRKHQLKETFDQSIQFRFEEGNMPEIANGPGGHDCLPEREEKMRHGSFGELLSEQFHS
jgi:hypothetical protein